MSEKYELLKEGLEGIIQHQQGKKKLKKSVVKQRVKNNSKPVKPIK